MYRIIYILLVIVIIITITNLFSFFRVSGDSMIPVLNDGDYAIVVDRNALDIIYTVKNFEKNDYLFKEEDIVVFSMPTVFGNQIVSYNKMFKRINNEYNYNDVLPYKNLIVKVNNHNYDEMKYLLLYDGFDIDDNLLLKIEEIDSIEYKFKNDFYFLIGDNKKNSIDSRSFGPIPHRLIEGLVVYSFSI